ncbi:hypothetical protein AAFF_G00068920 [Aldrovandia affinis]|uniref:Uncharacterized protein n=1 Tax=Aldrovandia affinis TaxID=143900 RepID=A0AAD7RZC4_9TELE|nr:hypothetical protein AAFF_G00068920 [Aldrovandia affinis]
MRAERSGRWGAGARCHTRVRCDDGSFGLGLRDTHQSARVKIQPRPLVARVRFQSAPLAERRSFPETLFFVARGIVGETWSAESVPTATLSSALVLPLREPGDTGEEHGQARTHALAPRCHEHCTPNERRPSLEPCCSSPAAPREH